MFYYVCSSLVSPVCLVLLGHQEAIEELVHTGFQEHSLRCQYDLTEQLILRGLPCISKAQPTCGEHLAVECTRFAV